MSGTRGFRLLVAALVLLPLAASQASEHTYRIGALLITSGRAKFYGEVMNRGIEMAVEEINKAGGVKGKKLEVVVEDWGYDTKRAVSGFIKLAEVDRIPVVITGGSDAVLAIAPVAEKYKVVNFNAAANSADIRTAGDYTFSNLNDAIVTASELATFVADRKKLHRVAFFGEKTEYGLSNAKWFKARFTEKGGTVLDEIFYTTGQPSDFKSPLTKLKSLDAEGVVLIGTASDVGRILKQAKQLGIKTPWFGSAEGVTPAMLELAEGAAEGFVYVDNAFDPQGGSPAMRAFGEKYRARYNQEPILYVATHYDAIYLIAKAIEAGGYSGEGIKNGLYQIKGHAGVLGSISFDKDGAVTLPTTMKMIKDGKFMTYRD
ncbi:MAG TPA: ABC transporter substrate-binding protein [Methylomirabilota bacterium]|nr:ABC transporter substrate-binding protein [Methylomirabilota bacterium]